MVDSKKRREQWIVEALLSTLDPTLLSRLRPSEGPDFFIADSVPKLGIEVRELYWGSDTFGRPLQVSEGAEDKIAAKAERLWYQRGLPLLFVTLNWQPSQPPRVQRADQIAQQLVDAIEANVYTLDVDGFPMELDQSGLEGDPLPDEICSVILLRSSALTRSSWNSNRAGYFGHCTSDVIVAALGDKEPLLAAYRTRADRIWLVLGIAGIAPSSFLEVPQSTIDCNYKSGFDRVFLAEGFDRKVHELNVGGPSQV
jgi:hypothetical protein